MHTLSFRRNAKRVLVTSMLCCNPHRSPILSRTLPNTSVTKKNTLLGGDFTIFYAILRIRTGRRTVVNISLRIALREFCL